MLKSISFLEGSDKTRSDFWGETMGPNGLGKEQKENSRKKEKGGGDRYIHVKSRKKIFCMALLFCKGMTIVSGYGVLGMSMCTGPREVWLSFPFLCHLGAE